MDSMDLDFIAKAYFVLLDILSRCTYAYANMDGFLRYIVIDVVDVCVGRLVGRKEG